MQLHLQDDVLVKSLWALNIVHIYLRKAKLNFHIFQKIKIKKKSPKLSNDGQVQQNTWRWVTRVIGHWKESLKISPKEWIEINVCCCYSLSFIRHCVFFCYQNRTKNKELYISFMFAEAKKMHPHSNYTRIRNALAYQLHQVSRNTDNWLHIY